MDTTAGGDDAFDAVAQETVAAASNLADAPAAPAAATVADSTAPDDAPAAPAGPDAAATQAPAMLSVPTPDDIAASLLAGASEPATVAASVPTGTAPTTAPPAVDTSFPASAPAVGAALVPPQDLSWAQLSAPAADIEMPQATIPQSDGPGDDLVEDIQAVSAVDAVSAVPVAGLQDSSPVAVHPTAALASTPAVSTLEATVKTSDPTAVAVDPAVAVGSALAMDLAGQAAVPASASVVPEAPQEAAPSATEPEISDEQIKAAWLSSVDEVYTVTKEEWSRRKPFEDAIKRPYFHVKPLDLAQLQYWSK